MDETIILGFYKYVDLADAFELRGKLKEFCISIGVMGRILIGKEGINGSISGSREQVDRFREFLIEDERFKDIFFKEEKGLGHPFRKMDIKVKNEIVSFGVDVNLQNKGKHIDGKEFLDLYDENGKLREGVVILDARNDYEYMAGKFKDAIHLDIKKFREFPEAVKKIESLKDKKIVMYCTGGIRCEKASAFLREKGFNDVSQLNMGIINFSDNHPNTVWQGKCFVFDRRMVSSMNEQNAETLTECKLCSVTCDHLRNCRNRGCNEIYVSCVECEDKFMGCCSEDCLDVYKKSAK